MRRRHAEIWFAWALPLIALRLLLPAGVMPTAGAYGPTLSICSPDNLDRSTPRGPESPKQGGSHEDMVCPFAASATTAPANAVAVVLPVHFGQILERIVPSAQRMAQAGPPRTQRSRAPPSIS